MARSSFSGAMLGRPPLASASYIPENSASIFPTASLTIWRIGRNGWSGGTKSSRRCNVNGLSVKVSAPRMGGLGWYRVRKKAASDYRVRRKTGRLNFEVFQRPARQVEMLMRMVDCAVAAAMKPRPRLRPIVSFESFMLSPDSYE